MRKLFVFVILIGLLMGNLAYSYPFQFREKFEEEKSRVQEKAEEVKGKIKDIAPKFDFTSPKEGKIKGKVKIEGKVKNADLVEFYYQLPGTISPVYLGRAQSKGENFWEFNWDTNLTPNGQYQLFAKIINQYGEYESERREITIENEIKRDEIREEKLKKEIEEKQIEIQEVNEKIIEKTEKIKEEIFETIKKRIEKGKEVLGEEEIKKVELEVIQELVQTEKEMRKETEDFVDTVKKEKNLERKIEEMIEENKKREERIEKESKELEKIREVKEKFQKIGVEEEVKKAKLLEKEKETMIEIEKKREKESEEKISQFKEGLEKVQQEKEEIKKVILEKISQPFEAIEKITPQEKKSQILEKKEEVKKETKISLDKLESEISEGEKIKEEKKTIILIKDSDGDDLSDEFEFSIRADPFNPDSDGDGFLDGVEYKLGYNPLKPGAADKVVYSDAKKAKPQKTEIYYVERVSTINLPTGQLGIKIEGKGLPNSFVTIYIYSSPIVMVTKTDSNGNWSIILDKPLADGIHEVYTTVTNNHGEVIARSDPYIFEKSGERIVAITLSGLLTEKTISPVQAYQLNFLILIIALVILAIGIALIIIGLSVQRKLKKQI